MTFTPSITSKIDTNNSTTTPLTSSATFTGNASDSSKFESCTLTITADTPSVNAGVRVEHSADGSNWDYVDVYTYDAKHEFIKTFQTKCAFIRVVYENATSAQSEFRLQLLMRANARADEKSPNLDAFGRLRVSNPQTLIEINHLRDINNTQETGSTTGTATQALDANSPFVLQSVSTTGDISIRQSRKRATYQPGKSHLILMSGVINAANNDTGVYSYIGYFDDSDGVMFTHKGNGAGGDMFVSLRSSGTGSVVSNEVPQSEWNIDALDGNGESGITLDPSKTLIFIFDMEWLGVGRVRTGFVIKGEIVYCHEFYHSNIETIPYMSMPSLPTRYEIRNVGVASASGSLKNICSQVCSEGGHSVIGRQFSVNTLANGGKAVTATLTPLVAIRLKSTHTEVNAIMQNYATLSEGKSMMATCLVMVRDDATAITGASWVSADDESAIEYDISGTAINMANAILLDNDFVESNTSKNTTGDVLNATLTSSISGVSDILVLCAQRVTTNGNGFASITWNEYL